MMFFILDIPSHTIVSFYIFPWPQFIDDTFQASQRHKATLTFLNSTPRSHKTLPKGQERQTRDQEECQYIRVEECQ